MDISQFSLREKIGQMVVCGFNGTEPSEEIMLLIKTYHIGGIIYFRRNLKDVEQVCRLSAELRKISEQYSSVPLCISMDQEGGMVARMDKGITLMPGNMALGAARDIKGVYDAALISGQELRSMGINMNYAPCIDINNNALNPVIGIRSFGERAELVSDMGAAALHGYQEAEIAATVKHFPGHGDTDTDSHLDLPNIPHDMKRLNELELVPFVRAIEAGVDAIMTAHVKFPAIESDSIPATLSKKVLTGLLRNELNFEGVIVTDCLEMNAISQGIGVAAGAVAAVEAGADLVLISHLLERQVSGIEALIHAVETGRISEARIDESFQRIVELKKRRAMEIAPPPYDEMEMNINSKKSWDIAHKLSEKSITLVKDTNQMPLHIEEPTYVVWPEVRTGTEVDEVIEQEETLGVILSGYMELVEEDIIGIYPTEEEINKVLDKSRAFKQLIFVSYNAASSPGQQKLISELAKREDLCLVVAAARNPFDLLDFPQIKTYIAVYENRPLAMKSLAKVLLGINKALGKLPVSISDPYPYEH